MSISTSISNSFKTSIASCITGKSLVLPIIIPTLLIDFLVIVYVVFFLINLSIFLRLRSAELFEVTLFANHPNAVLYLFCNAPCFAEVFVYNRYVTHFSERTRFFFSINMRRSEERRVGKEGRCGLLG